MSFAIMIREIGGPECLRWERVSVGAPGVGQVRLRHTAIGVNFADVYYRTGLYPTALPFVPGREGAGVVEAVGPDVGNLRVGDRVAYAAILGSYAEFKLCEADQIVKLPDSIGDETAAAVTLQGMTVRYLLKDVYKVSAGDTILVHAAAGGVGLLMCQWASALGATVIGTVSSDVKAALAEKAGCTHSIVYTREDFAERVLEITRGRKLRVVYDSVGRDTFRKSLECLQPRGLMVLFGQSSGPVAPVDPNLLGRLGSLVLTRPMLSDFVADRKALEQTASDVYEALDTGIIRETVGQTFPLRDAAEAHRALEERRTTGSTVLTV